MVSLSKRAWNPEGREEEEEATFDGSLGEVA